MVSDPTSSGLSPAPVAPSVSTRDPYAQSWLVKIGGPLLGLAAAASAFYSRVTEDFESKIKREFGVKQISDIRYIARDTLRELELLGAGNPDKIKAVKKKIEQLVEPYVLAGSGVKDELAALKETAFAQIDNVHAASIEGRELPKIVSAGIKKIEDVYTQNKASVLTKFGYETKGFARLFKGTLQRFNNIGHTKQQGALVGAAISGGALFASLFILNQNTRLRRELKDVHSQVDDVSSSVEDSGMTPAIAAHDHAPRTQINTLELAHADTISSDTQRTALR